MRGCMMDQTEFCHCGEPYSFHWCVRCRRPVQGEWIARMYGPVVSQCPGCHRFSAGENVQPWDEGVENWCRNCSPMCSDCDEPGTGFDDYGRCANCEQICNDCGESVYEVDDEGLCSSCDAPDLMGYRHTEAHTFLGQDDYYLGIELEVSSGCHRSEITATRDLCEEMLGHRMVDLKEDGSVDGFEMAFQPMSPQFFEDFNWNRFFRGLDDAIGPRREPTRHGLHVHISRTAFDEVSGPMFVYLMSRLPLEEIGRREETHYCRKFDKIASALIAQRGSSAQAVRLYNNRAPRGAINVHPDETIEIRAFRSARTTEHLKDAVRTVYLAAEYVRALRRARLSAASNLTFDKFLAWIEANRPDLYPTLAKFANLDDYEDCPIS